MKQPILRDGKLLGGPLPQRQHPPANKRMPDVAFNIRKCYVWSMNADSAHTPRFCRLKICLVAGELCKPRPIHARHGTTTMKKEER